MMIRLLGALLTKGATKKEAILTLANLGFTPGEVGEILGVSSHQVSVTVHAAKKGARRRSRS
jgi:DNA-directed RNA polymerase specialized sigma24 family protein